MNRQEAVNEYRQARKLGQRCYRSCLHRGQYPYLPVLDQIMGSAMTAGQVELGLVDVPSDQIVGTKSAGRESAFAADFMPLLELDTEFAMKWIALCEAHLSDEGIRDPIRCYEYLGRFYVQEGNKRASVLKYFGTPSISAEVVRLLPVATDDLAIRLYYEFLHFYRLSGTYWLRFDQPGLYEKLQAALGFEPDQVWTKEERQRVLSVFFALRGTLAASGKPDGAEAASNALLVCAQVYTLEELRLMTTEQRTAAVTAMYPDMRQLEGDPTARLATEPQEPDKNFLSRLHAAFLPNHLDVAFVHALPPGESLWIAAHEQGRRALEEAMPDRVSTRAYVVSPEQDADRCIDQAVADGAQVIFTTTPSLIAACRKAAANHPEVKLLNCSVSMPYTGVRTYYSRIYEGKFISGAVAGAMSRSDTIGYIASSPIFGVPAGINAFALGARMTNPRARVKLVWSCSDPAPLTRLVEQGVDMISNRDVPLPTAPQEAWGLCQMSDSGALVPLVSPLWNWGTFYCKLVSLILGGGWEAAGESGSRAVNYWWGMRAGVVELRFAEHLPEGVRTLAQLLQQELIHDRLAPFHRALYRQDGSCFNDGSRWPAPEELLRMDWLCDLVEGQIPRFEELLPMAQPIVRLQGIYRQELKPEKDGVIL